MSLKKILRQHGYDLIDGPVRNQKLLQLWLKKIMQAADFYYADVSYAFKSDIPLDAIENPALSVTSSDKEEYGFNIGVTLLDDILKTLGLGALELSVAIKSGKKVTISYDNSVTREVPKGTLENYFYAADFVHPNPQLLKNANHNNILIFSGIILAKNLVVEIETDFSVDIDLVAKLNAIADGKAGFSSSGTFNLKMIADSSDYFPIAVKAHRVDYDKGKFSELYLYTDKGNIG